MFVGHPLARNMHGFNHVMPNFSDQFPDPIPADTSHLNHLSTDPKQPAAPTIVLDRTVTTELMSIAQSPERDALLAEHALLLERVKNLVGAQRSAKAAELEAQRSELWAECRSAEEEKTSLMNRAGALRGRLAAAAQDLSSWRVKLADSRPQFNTRFPTPAEVSAWNGNRHALIQEVDRRTAAHVDAVQQLNQVNSQYNATTVKLSELVEKLRAVDSELNTTIRGDKK